MSAMATEYRSLLMRANRLMGANLVDANLVKIDDLGLWLSRQAGIPAQAFGRTLLATDYAHVERVDDAFRDANLAMALRPNDAMVMYNVACVFGQLGRKPEALEALRKAKDAGWKDATWARRDPDLAILHGDPDFDALYPPGVGE